MATPAVPSTAEPPAQTQAAPASAAAPAAAAPATTGADSTSRATEAAAPPIPPTQSPIGRWNAESGPGKDFKSPTPFRNYQDHGGKIRPMTDEEIARYDALVNAYTGLLNEAHDFESLAVARGDRKDAPRTADDMKKLDELLQSAHQLARAAVAREHRGMKPVDPKRLLRETHMASLREQILAAKDFENQVDKSAPDYAARLQVAQARAAEAFAQLRRWNVGLGSTSPADADQRSAEGKTSEINSGQRSDGLDGKEMSRPASTAPPRTIVNERGETVYPDGAILKNWLGRDVVIPKNHIMSLRDPPMDAPPKVRPAGLSDPRGYTDAERAGFLAGNDGGTFITPHHRHQLALRDGGVIDELPRLGHPEGEVHRGKTPTRHPNDGKRGRNGTVFSGPEGGKLHAHEVRQYFIEKGTRLVRDHKTGLWLDPLAN